MTLNKILNKNHLGRLNIKSNKHLNIFDKEIKLSKHIPISHFVSREIFSTRNGDLGAVIKIEGTSFDVKGTDELNQLQSNQAFALQTLSEDYAVYVTTYRNCRSTSLKSEYSSYFSKEFNKAYSNQFEQSELFVNDIYITLIKKQKNLNKSNRASLLKNFRVKFVKESFASLQQNHLNEFKNALTNFITMLSPFSPMILGEKVISEEIGQSEVLGFLSILINGKPRNLIYPYQNIANFIPEKRIFFGHKTIHFQGLYEGDDYFAAILSIKHYSPTSVSGMLNELLTVPTEYITTHSYLGIEKNTAIKMIDIQIKRFNSTGDAAKSQIAELEFVKDDIASGRINYGFHHNTILVISHNIHDLEEKVAKIIKIYHDQRLVLVRETLNLESAFWAQIPGNFKYIRRSALVSNHNFSSFCPLHNYYSGYINQNHLGGALMLVETPSKTPFYFNLHEKGSGRKDDLAKGHTLLIGPSNAGKTVIMTAIDSMSKKYGARSFFFDRNLGCEIYIRAMGGIYNRLIPGETTHWNPCQIQDTPKNRHFLSDFLAALSSDRTITLSSSDYRQIAEVVERNFTLPFEKRNLSNISSFFRLDFSGLDALSRYLKLSDRTGKPGDLAYLFDNEMDCLDFSADTYGFDMTHWLSDAGQPPAALLPISMYLFQRMESCFDGQLTGIYLDEGWQFLQQAYWKKKIQEYLVTLRKCNVYLFLSTQLPDKLAESDLASALIQGTATHIFLSNPKAQEKDYITSFKLTPREYELVKNFSLQSRQFLYKQGQESAIVKINLEGLDRYLAVLSGNEKSVRLCESIRKEYGNNPEIWLPHFYDERTS